MPNPGPIPQVDILSGVSQFIADNTDLLQQKVDGKGKASPPAGSAKKNNAALGNFRDDVVLALVDAIEKKQIGSASPGDNSSQVKTTLAELAARGVTTPLTFWNLDEALNDEVLNDADTLLTHNTLGSLPAWELISGDPEQANEFYGAYFDGRSSLEATGGVNPGSFFNIDTDITVTCWARQDYYTAEGGNNDPQRLVGYYNRSSTSVGTTTAPPWLLSFREWNLGANMRHGHYETNGSTFDAVDWINGSGQKLKVPVCLWAHHAFKRVRNGVDDNDLFMYVNGRLVNTVLAQPDANLPNSANQRMLIGGGRGGTNGFSGTIRDVGIWDSPIADSEILEVYKAGIGLA